MHILTNIWIFEYDHMRNTTVRLQNDVKTQKHNVPFKVSASEIWESHIRNEFLDCVTVIMPVVSEYRSFILLENIATRKLLGHFK